MGLATETAGGERERRKGKPAPAKHPALLVGKMGETEEEKDQAGKLFENFIQASTCKGTLQSFNLLCRLLDLDPQDHETFYCSLKTRLTSWRAKALWTKLDKRTCHKEYKKGQACVGTKVSKQPLTMTFKEHLFCIIQRC